MAENRITQLLKIRYPIVQAGMVWCSGWKLASAVANAGGLGLLGAGSMDPELLRLHIRKCREASTASIGVNIPLMYKYTPDHIRISLEEKVPVVFTSAGNPSLYTQKLKDAGVRVIHVVASQKFAEKAEMAGVDALVAEGVEAGGHNGKEENTSFTLLPLIRKSTSLPIISAGGIATGAGMLAAMVLGAEGVQIGTRFAVSLESSAHPNFKNRIIQVKDGDTRLLLRKTGAVRMVMNAFARQIEDAEARGASPEELLSMAGPGKTKSGIFEGNLEEGELEIGQVASLLEKIQPASEIISEIVQEFNTLLEQLKDDRFRL